MKGTLPSLIAAFLTAVTLFALAGYQVTSEKPATRLLGRQAAALIEIDRWLPAHRPDLELLAQDRPAGVISVSSLPVKLTVPSAVVLDTNPDILSDVMVYTMGSLLYKEGAAVLQDDQGKPARPGIDEPFRWSIELLSEGAHSFWQAALAITALILLASVAAVLMGGGSPIAPLGIGAGVATALSVAVWALAQAGKGMSSAPVDQEVMMALRDGAWIGIRNGAAVTVLMIGVRLLLNTFAGRDNTWHQQSRGWDFPDAETD